MHSVFSKVALVRLGILFLASVFVRGTSNMSGIRSRKGNGLFSSIVSSVMALVGIGTVGLGD